jgi:hypothetical protein
MFKLTRFLYNEEEVKLSLIASILTKKNIFECYYWFSELYYSKIDICDIIWEIYFDYYALINPKLENYISKKITDWKANYEIDHLLYIIKNFHISKHDSRVFLLRNISMSENLCQKNIYHNTNSKIIKKYDNKYHPLLLSIKMSRWIDICYYLNKIFKNSNIDTGYEIYKNIFNYLLRDDPSLNKIFDNLWKIRIDNRDFHFTLKMICRSMLQTNCVSVKSVYVSPLKEDIDEIKSLEQSVIPVYKTLSNRRYFKIDENIGSFDLVRFSVSNYKNENYNWEYYASFTPLWKERINTFKATVNDENKTIEFEDDETLENFYEKYGYELDEQSKEVQDYSMLPIVKKSWIEWFSYVGYGFLGHGDVNKKVFEINNDMIKINMDIDILLDDMPDNFRLK